jgi:hypothetical protein
MNVSYEGAMIERYSSQLSYTSQIATGSFCGLVLGIYASSLHFVVSPVLIASANQIRLLGSQTLFGFLTKYYLHQSFLMKL